MDDARRAAGGDTTHDAPGSGATARTAGGARGEDGSGRPGSASPRQRLLDAAWFVLGETGARAATTRAIARQAGVNEVTVFRLYGTKDDLLAAALRERTSSLARLTLEPSGDVRSDLLRLASTYQDLARRDVGVLLKLLPDLERDPTLLATVQPVLQQLTNAARTLFTHHRTRGALTAAQPVDHLIWAFLGPLFATASLRGVLDLDDDIDPLAYVDRYLAGHEVR